MNSFWLFDAPSIGDIREVVTRMSLKRPKEKAASATGAKCGRHVKWTPGTQYRCIREGVQLESESELDRLFKTKQLAENMFYIFKNVDKHVSRNQDVPLYEAAYKCGDVFVTVQKRHLKQAYTNSKRTETASMWLILADGTPYHVDRYAYCKQSQLESKKRYEKKIKH